MGVKCHSFLQTTYKNLQNFDADKPEPGNNFKAVEFANAVPFQKNIIELRIDEGEIDGTSTFEFSCLIPTKTLTPTWARLDIQQYFMGTVGLMLT